ncbi:DUF5372 family protein, partial [Mesorhizobium sp. WSM3866]|uniref:DUF5372 family protein n=1 Tax=Mesorhizobium sp. WSM3866 TaxID=422271 RepID=UPI001FDEABE3
MVSYLTVIDPRHGLAGQRLELVSSRAARGPAFVVVRLPDGRRRSIRRAVTDLAVASAEEQGAPKSAARISVRTLLTLLHHLNRTLASPVEVRISQKPDRGSANSRTVVSLMSGQSG